MYAIKSGNGRDLLTTVAGGKLTAILKSGKDVITDKKGGNATLTKTDLKASNGVIHVINAVLMHEAK